MGFERTDWFLDDRLMRFAFAAGVTLIGIGALITRNDPAVDWSLVSPVVAVYWLWAVVAGFPRWPLYLLGLTVPFVLNVIESEAEVSMFIVIFTLSVLAAFEPNRTVVTTLALSSYLLLWVFSQFVFDDVAWENWAVGMGFAWAAGTVVSRYRVIVDELQHTRTLVADQAAVHERRRIARDVHDLVGHSLSVVMLHVTGARHLIQRDPAEAERALEQAEEAGRQSLAEIRRTVGLLRDERDPDRPPLPSPDLGDLPELVDEFMLAGLDVRLESEAVLHVVEGATAVAGYRIVQEALTNASRHTVGAEVVVAITVIGDVCEIAVRNHGGMPTEAPHGSGFGLISMRERAKSVGGSLIAGPIPSGWAVEASLPILPVGAGA